MVSSLRARCASQARTDPCGGVRQVQEADGRVRVNKINTIKVIHYDPPEDPGRRAVWDAAEWEIRELRANLHRLSAPAHRLRVLAEELYESERLPYALNWRIRNVLDEFAIEADRFARVGDFVLGLSARLAVWEAVRKAVGTGRMQEIGITDWQESVSYSTIGIGEAEIELRDEAMRPMGDDDG